LTTRLREFRGGRARLLCIHAGVFVNVALGYFLSTQVSVIFGHGSANDGPFNGGRFNGGSLYGGGCAGLRELPAFSTHHPPSSPRWRDCRA